MAARIAVREVRANPGRTLLALLGVALGVALVVAVSLVIRSGTAAFSAMVDAFAGEAVLEVSGGDAGLGEELLNVVRAVPGVKRAAPLVLGNVYLDDASGAAVAIVGVDVVEESGVRGYQAVDADDATIDDPLVFLNSRESALVAEGFLRQHGLRVGDAIGILAPAGRRRLVARGALRPEGAVRRLGDNLAVLDVYAAQALFDKERKIDRISVTLREGSAVDDVARALAARLPAGVAVERPAQRGAEIDEMLAGFRYSLSTLSLFALLVGGCIVYNSLATAVVRRRQQFGILRALGSRRRDVVRLVLAEAALLGLTGVLVGAPAGLWLARALLGLVKRSAEVQSAVSLGQPSVVAPNVADGLKALAGLAIALVAGWLPARQAGRVPVVEVLRPGLSERWIVPVHGRAAAVGLALLAAAGALIAIGALRHSPIFIGVGTAVLVCGFLLVATAGAAVFASRSERPLGLVFGVKGWLASAALARHPYRTGVTAAVLALGTLLYVFVTVVHQSFRESFIHELGREIAADLIVTSAFLSGGALTAPVDDGVAASLRALPDVAGVACERRLHVDFRGARVSLAAVDESYFTDGRFGRKEIVAGPADAGQTLVREGGVFVSDNFAMHFGVRPGDSITLDTPRGPVDLPVAAVVIDNFDNVGTVLLDRGTYVRWWNDRLVNWMYVLVAPGAGVDAVERRILERFNSTFRLRVVASRAFLEHVGSMVDQGFGFAKPLQAVVLLVVLLSLGDTLLMSVFGRVREIGMLRAVGFRRTDVLGLVVLEGVVIGLFGALCGFAGGVLLSGLWMRVHVKYLFGWTIGLHYPLLSLLPVPPLVAVVAALAAAVPAIRGSRLAVSRSLAYE